MDDLAILKVLETICEYYAIKLSAALKEIWLKDFFSYSAKQLQQAFDKWRADDATRDKKPKSFDLVKLMKLDEKNLLSFQPLQNSPKERWEDIPENSEINLRLKSDLRKMFGMMPDLVKRVGECGEVAEKFTMCAVALGKPELVDMPFGKILTKNMQMRFKDPGDL